MLSNEVIKPSGVWTACDKSCNGGTKQSLAICVNAFDGVQIEDDTCNLTSNQQVVMKCNMQLCSGTNKSKVVINNIYVDSLASLE